MSKFADKKLVCIHGHFYQPPRENPWLGEIEREESAVPYHDWNERINFECYRANSAARLVDDKNRVLNLRNNYKLLSFNFGPTLFQWIERHDPWVYRAIIEADQESVRLQGGHGNAVAQVYNHIIMPLASLRDRVTQIRWGIRDFEMRFGRPPEGMWLAETAVDRTTLSLLAEEGIKFTILSPYQAARWRPDTEGGWRDASGGTIPSGRAYRYDCGGGKFIHLFFYDPSLARGIAFENLLGHSGRLLDQIDRCWLQRPDSDEPWLVHSATDGESYGHHFKFGDMALAAAFGELERDPGARVLNYGAFLAEFPVRAEAEIVENSSWSCAHGVGRWSADCGCRMSSDPNVTQKWRAPLRRALNDLRDVLATHFERRMAKLCKDPWKVRNAYIDAVLDPEKNMEPFLAAHLAPRAGAKALPLFLELLEMQRFSLLMFTSCGWFFDEIGQIESMLLLKYAARAMQLAVKTGAASFEHQFLKILEEAPSNLPEFGNGANVYLKKVKPEIVDDTRAAASYAIQSLACPLANEPCVCGYEIFPEKDEDLGSLPVPCRYGRVRIKHPRTLEESDFLYAVIHFGALDFRCSVKPYKDEKEYGAILKALQSSVEKQNTVEMVRVLDEKFGTAYFSLHDVFRDLRSSIALAVSRRTLANYTDLQRSVYQMYKPLLSSFRQWKIRIPSDLRVAVRRVLSDELGQLVSDIVAHEQENGGREERSFDSTDFFYRAHIARIKTLFEDARSWGISLQLERTSKALGRVLVQRFSELIESFDPNQAGKLLRLLNICRVLSIRPESWKLQTLYFQFVTKGVKNPELFEKIRNIDGLLNELDEILWCSFARLPKEGRGA